MKWIKCILPFILFTAFGLFQYLEYENIDDLEDSYTGFGILLSQLFMVLYGLLGRLGTMILLFLIGVIISFAIWNETINKKDASIDK